MHVEISGDPGKAPKHAGQKKTYKAVSTPLPASCPLRLSVVFPPRTTLPPPPCSPFLSFTTRAVCCLTRAPLSLSLFLFFGLHSSLSVSGQRTTVCFQFLMLTQQPRCGPVGVLLRARSRADRDEQKTLSDVNERLPHMAEFTRSSEVFVFGYKRVKSLISKLRQSFFGPNKQISESIRRRGCALLCRSLAAAPSGRPLSVQRGGIHFMCVMLEGSFPLSSVRLLVLCIAAA